MSKRSDLLRQLVAECLELMEEEGNSAVEVVCAEHPELADAIRRRLAILRERGLAELDVGGELPDGWKSSDWSRSSAPAAWASSTSPNRRHSASTSPSS